jgi:phosphomannomutase / phosphoglucomutase
LAQAVEHHRAYLGIAFDGDGDRMSLVDDQGVPLTAEETTWVLLQSFTAELPGEKFIYDQKFSDRVPEEARILGAEPLVERSGHTFLRGRMLKTGAIFGAEVSGHYFFRELSGGDDGLFAACRVISYLAQCGRPLSELRRQVPQVFITPDLRVPVKPKDQKAVLAQVRKTWSKHPQTELDGIRITLPDGWALIRGSISEPALTFRFESTHWHTLGDTALHFCETLPTIGALLWVRYQDAMGLSHCCE